MIGELVSIGIVERNGAIIDPAQFFDPALESTIAIDEQWEPALAGLADYSHLVVLFWLDRAERATEAPSLRPVEGREELPPVGLFGTRTPRRPNPIELSMVKLLAIDGRRLTVTGLDAWPGTPIVDIKGYTTRDELRPEASNPVWLEQLWSFHDRERRGS
jgi:tRNA-Thr(GGU) m(6)t(6)A37 methyltransferase TsaA